MLHRIGEIVHCAATSQKLLEHHDATGTSELSDMLLYVHKEWTDALDISVNTACMSRASVRIHWRVGASVRHLCSVYKCIWAECEWHRLLYNLAVIPVAWGSYYRNVIGVGGNWRICYLKGCNVSSPCLNEYFSLFCILHYCNFQSMS